MINSCVEATIIERMREEAGETAACVITAADENAIC